MRYWAVDCCSLTWCSEGEATSASSRRAKVETYSINQKHYFSSFLRSAIRQAVLVIN